MKTNILPALKLTLLTLLFFTVLYPALIWAVAKAAPGGGRGETVVVNGKKYYSNIGQNFSDDKYFDGRPSAVDYNAAGSVGSNKGPSNPEYLATVQARIDTFLVHNPGIQKSDIPVELVTASGSGLDPDISLKAAKVQVSRIAAARKLPEATVADLVQKHTQQPLLGLFGPEHINVLQLNLALDALQ